MEVQLNNALYYKVLFNLKLLGLILSKQANTKQHKESNTKQDLEKRDPTGFTYLEMLWLPESHSLFMKLKYPMDVLAK